MVVLPRRTRGWAVGRGAESVIQNVGKVKEGKN